METISIYQVEDTPIGSGGMGRVYRGTDPQGRKVAIKEILPQFASDLEIRLRTEREVELLQQLNNDSIVKVLDQFPSGDNFYIVMEFVDGLNIEQYVQKYGAIPYERAAMFMVKILEAMQVVHEKNFVHRDMKPSNVMIRNDERICILDFGIAKDLSNQSGSYNTTVLGTVIGSDGYMSPEQADGFSIDHRADIYALGCVFYYMLTGHHAYNTLSSDYETRTNITKTPFPKLSDNSKKSFPQKLQEILDHATDKNMMKRYQSCREFRIDLEGILHQTGTHITPSENENVYITVGREGCDILIDDSSYRVSRSHLDIVYRQFTGGRFYVITDHSSNGTMVNGRRLNRGESENIPADSASPKVLLACDEKYLLDWVEVKRLIASKLNPASNGQKDDPTGLTQVITPSSHKKDIAFWDAMKLFLTRALDFKGRSRRKEYWYVCLANAIIQIPYYFLLAESFMTDDYIKPEITLLYVLYYLAFIIPYISLTLRRLHDIGKDWKMFFWWLAFFIPFINLVILILWIIWMATDSQRIENKWGPCPK